MNYSKGPKVPWTKEQEIFLKQNYDKLPILELAQMLNRTRSAIGLKAGFLGLLKTTVIEKLSKEELTELYVNQGLSSTEIGEIKNINSGTILYLLHIYEIPRRSSLESQHLRYLRKPPKFGPYSSLWKKGFIGAPGDYRYVTIYPDSPFYEMVSHKKSGSKYNGGKSIAEHRLIMAQHLNRLLDRKEIVHHINGIKDDNRIENLELVTKQSIHVSIGARVRELDKEIRLLKVQVKVLTKRLNSAEISVPSEEDYSRELEGTWLEEGNLRW